jgi:magnesium chelatase subunit D
VRSPERSSDIEDRGDDASGERRQGERPERESKRGANPRGDERSAPPADARLPDAAPEFKSVRPKIAAERGEARRVRQPARSSVYASRGCYTGASTASRVEGARVALDASLRAAALRQPERRAAAHASPIFCFEADDLRFKRLRRKSGALYILAIDTSGSMAANRINQAKGALARLLRQSYVRRDRVALISFRERSAELLLAPSAAPARAKRILDALPVGGATPLAAGLLRALEVAERARGAGARRIALVVFTDGRANVPCGEILSEDRAASKSRIRAEIERCGAALQRAGVASLVIDTESRFTSGGEGQLLSRALGGRYAHLPTRASQELIDEILS